MKFLVGTNKLCLALRAEKNSKIVCRCGIYGAFRFKIAYRRNINNSKGATVSVSQKKNLIRKSARKLSW